MNQEEAKEDRRRDRWAVRGVVDVSQELTVSWEFNGTARWSNVGGRKWTIEECLTEVDHQVGRLNRRLQDLAMARVWLEGMKTLPDGRAAGECEHEWGNGQSAPALLCRKCGCHKILGKGNNPAPRREP